MGKKIKRWDHYPVFQELSHNNNYTLVQAVDIIDDPSYAVSWRNGHPNQKAIRVIADSILDLILK